MPAAVAEKRQTRATPATKPTASQTLLKTVLPAMARLPPKQLQREVAGVLNSTAQGKMFLLGLDRLRRVIEAALPAPKRAAAARDVVPDLIASAQVMASTDFAQRMGWTRQALSKALQARRVFFLESGGERYYPAFYDDRRQERRHLEAVSKLLGDLPGGSKWLFFTTPKGSLAGRTPLQALTRGKLDAVKTAAQGYAER